jgi:transcriptional regulator of acetoin/glycerol metabolism
MSRREFITLLGGAAGMAGIDRNHLYRTMKKHGIARKE